MHIAPVEYQHAPQVSASWTEPSIRRVSVTASSSCSAISKEVRLSITFFSQVHCSCPGGLRQFSSRGLKEYLKCICLPIQQSHTPSRKSIQSVENFYKAFQVVYIRVKPVTLCVTHSMITSYETSISATTCQHPRICHFLLSDVI